MKKFLPILLIFLALAVLAVLGADLLQYSDNAADIAQAQAAIEAARAAQIAGAGLASVSTLLTVLVIVVVIFLLAEIGLVIWLALRQKLAAEAPKRWVSGPNAQYRQIEPTQPSQKALPPGDPMQQLVQLMVLRELGRMNSDALPPAQQQPRLSAMVDDDEPIQW
jgi:hypothetical protein